MLDNFGEKDDSLIVIRGIVDRIAFRNENVCRTIAKIWEFEKRDIITVLGTLMDISPEQEVELKGSWRTHPKFEFFEVVSYRILNENNFFDYP